MNKRSSYSGFSLIELICVTVLLAVVLAFSVPNFISSFTQLQLKKEAEEMVYVMRYAQSRCVSRNVPVKLEFSEDFSRYWLTEEGVREKTDSAKEGFVPVPGRMGQVHKLTDNIYIESDNKDILFYTDGRIEKRRIYICRENTREQSQDRCWTVSTQEQRGYVRLFEEKI